MHDLSGHASFYVREHRVFIGNSIELLVTDDRAKLLIGPIDKDAPMEPVVFTTPPIVHAFRIVAQVLEEQGGLVSDDVDDGRPKVRVICEECRGYGGFDDHYGNWTECAACHGAGTCVAN